MVVGSALVHAGALGLVFVSPVDRDHEPPRVISVELVSPSPAASPPAPKVAVAPPPEAAPPPPPPEAEPEPPPPPKPDTVVLPEKPQAPKPKAKEKPKPKAQKEVFKEPPKKEKEQAKSLDEVLAEMRGSDPMAPVQPAPSAGEQAVDTAVAPGASSGSGDPLSPEEAAWHARVIRHLKGIWTVPAGFRMQPLETRVMVTLDAQGNIIGEPRIEKKSGNPWYDEGAVRGVAKASPLPPPPEPGDWPVLLRAEDSF